MARPKKDAPAWALGMDLAFKRCQQPEKLAKVAAGIMGAKQPSLIEAEMDTLADGPGSGQDQSRYIAAEGSYTGDPKDTARAMRNAAIITRATGAKCGPALLSVRNDDEADEQSRDGLLHWYQLEEPEPELP